jgi:hypothetical protein
MLYIITSIKLGTNCVLRIWNSSVKDKRVQVLVKKNKKKR